MKKFISLLIAAILICTCGVVAFAEGEDAGTPKTFTVTYDPNNADYKGETPIGATVNEGEYLVITPNLVLDGYKFLYWNTEKDGSGVKLIAKAQYEPKSDQVLYGIWEKLGDTKEEDTAFAITGYHLPTTAELETLSGSIRNYSSDYWKKYEVEQSQFATYVDAAGTIKSGLANDKRAVRPVLDVKNVTKSGHKVGDTFTFGGKNYVIISENAAFCLTDIANEQIYDSNLTLNGEFETTALYRFLEEWYANNTGNGYKFITVEEEDGTYTLSFDTAGLKTIEAIKLAKDAAITLPDATVTGYKFNGWFADNEFKTKFETTKMPAENITIYASYTKLYKLSFDTQELKKIDAMWLEEGATIVLPAADVENYKFMGWCTDAKYEKAVEKDAKMPKADTTLYGCYAIKLSKLSGILSDVDMEQFVKDSKLSAETFNKLAKTLGFEVKYNVNDKSYTVNNIVNFDDEIIAQLKKDIKSGDVACVDITISLGKDDSENMSFYVYNDIGVKEDDKPTAPVSDPTKPNSEGKKSDGGKTIDIPNTGAESIAPAIITFLTSVATVGGAVVLKKKKEN